MKKIGENHQKFRKKLQKCIINAENWSKFVIQLCNWIIELKFDRNGLKMQSFS